jgi:hypothetical protein
MTAEIPGSSLLGPVPPERGRLSVIRTIEGGDGEDRAQAPVR